MMVLDECVPYGADYQYTKQSLGLTTLGSQVQSSISQG